MTAKSKYDSEFKIRAVKYYKTKRKSLRKAGYSLGVPASTLREWVEAYNHKEKKFSISGTTKTYEEEYRLLKKQLEEAITEKDTLKKALMIFSQAKT